MAQAQAQTPGAIARETLTRLAAARQAPTPDNFQRVYNEIAGITTETGVALIVAIKARLNDSPRPKVELNKTLRIVDELARSQKWPELAGLLIEQLGQLPVSSTTLNWPTTVRELLRQWDVRQVGWSTARKKEAIEKVLINFGQDPDQLCEKLAGLSRTWSENKAPEGEALVDEAPPADGGSAVGIASALAPVSAPVGAVVSVVGGELVGVEGATTPESVWQAWRDILAATLEHGVAARLAHVPDLQEEAQAMIVRTRDIRDAKGLVAFTGVIKKFWLKLELRNESDQTLLLGLQRLLQLLVGNISDLVVDDAWLQGQVEVIRAVLDRPLDSRYLYEVEANLSELIFKQGNLKQSLTEAKASFKSMITTFIDRLGAMADSTGGYHDKVVNYADRIRGTDDFHLITGILADLMEDTRLIQVDMLRSRDQLQAARAEAEAAEAKIAELEQQITEMSEKVKHDQLTGVLNRRGLEEALEVELARVNREHGQLCVALLDIDNFKKLNDRLGHQAGDQALSHLAKVVGEALRPTDVIARYGGEEFVLLLPATSLEEAVTVMQRVQRELTRQFFLHNNERQLITFSCGVAQYREGETEDAILARADAAMYEAKLGGKNQVMTAR